MNHLIDITLSEQQREGTQATLQQWLVAVGDKVKADDPIAELETDKVTMEVCAPKAGVIKELLIATGDEVTPDAVLGRLDIHQTEADIGIARKSDAQQPPCARHLVGPAVRRLLRQHNLDIELIDGSGRDGRVTRNDVLSYLQNTPADTKPEKPSPAPTFPATNPGSTPSHRVEHTSMRRHIAKHMVESLLHTSPHVTSVFEMDMTNVIEHRRWHKKEFLEQGVNLTFTAYFLAAAALAIKAVPEVNARFHEDALEIFDTVNIGVGTALDDQGLVVPVITQVQQKNLLQIAEALQTQTNKAREGKLVAADMKNGTFTLSNHGVSGSLLASPIVINQPQVAILGIGKLEKRAVVVETPHRESIEIRPRCYVTLTIDHRALDGFQANKFLSIFVNTLECWGQ